MAKIKVWGTTTMPSWHRKQVRVVVATTSQKRAAEAFGVSMYDFNQYASITGNKTDVREAMKRLHQPVYFVLDSYKPTVMLVPLED